MVSKLIKTEIVNVVATADLKQRINLGVVGKLKVAEYAVDKYGGRVAYLKTSQMRGKVSLFDTGKMISVGTKSPETATQELNHIRNFLEKEKIIEPIALEPKVRNIVFLVDFGKEIDLENLGKKSKSIYEPEQFPGAILRIQQPKATALLFSSGKAIIAGLTDPQQIFKVKSKILQIIE